MVVAKLCLKRKRELLLPGDRVSDLQDENVREVCVTRVTIPHILTAPLNAEDSVLCAFDQNKELRGAG